MVDNKNSNNNSKGSYAAVVGANDNQPEGTVVASESQPPPCELARRSHSPAVMGTESLRGEKEERGRRATMPSKRSPTHKLTADTASGAPGPSTQPPPNPKHAAPSNQHYAQVHKAGQGSSAPLLPHHQHTRVPTPGQAESGMVVLVAHSPEYYYALSRARRRFWGALFWAFLIYLVAACVLLVIPVGLLLGGVDY